MQDKKKFSDVIQWAKNSLFTSELCHERSKEIFDINSDTGKKILQSEANEIVFWKKTIEILENKSNPHP